MTIALTACGDTLDSQLDSHFGRCRYFIVVDGNDGSHKVVENEHINRSGGAGIQAAALMADLQVDCVLTGNVGPNAHKALSAAGIKVCVGCSGKIDDVLRNYLQGSYTPAEQPSVESHHGA